MYNRIFYTNYANIIKDYDILKKIYNMFDLSCNQHDKIDLFKKVKIINGPIMKEEVKAILKLDGFIFPC